MNILRKPSRIRLNDIALITSFPPWASEAMPYALALAREHRSRMHVAHPVSANAMERVAQMPADGGFRRSWRDVMFEQADRHILLQASEFAIELRRVGVVHHEQQRAAIFGQRNVDAGIDITVAGITFGVFNDLVFVRNAHGDMFVHVRRC